MLGGQSTFFFSFFLNNIILKTSAVSLTFSGSILTFASCGIHFFLCVVVTPTTCGESLDRSNRKKNVFFSLKSECCLLVSPSVWYELEAVGELVLRIGGMFIPFF